MKNIYSKLVLIVFSVLAVGCQDDDSLSHTNVSAVNALYAPANDKFYDLSAQSSAVFEWESAKAEDNGVVLYDVVFDREDGDFSQPIYTIPSDGKGFQPILNLSFTELNKIAEMAVKMGHGHELDIGIEGEKPGLVPTKDWKEKRYKGWDTKRRKL